MKIISLSTIILLSLALAGCGTYGAGISTPIAGASAGVTIGPPVGPSSYPNYVR